MACNCGKNKTRPFGMKTTEAKSASTSEPKKYVLRTRLGQTRFNSRLEAEAAKTRAGGGQIIEVY